MSINSRRWYALAVMLAAVFLAAFDFNVVTIAIPSIQRGLGTNFGEIQLIVAGYALSFAVLLITGGRLGDLYGRRRMYSIGMAGFTIASALCGFAPSPTALIGARVLQGAFAAVMVPQALSFIEAIFTPHEQSLAYAICGMTIGFGMIAGQVLGGLLVSADLLGLAWGPVFLVHLPFGVVAITLSWRLVPESRAGAGLKLDLGGVALVSAALALLLYPLIRGEAAGWPAWTWLSLAGAAVLMVVFVRYERWKTDRDGSPLVVLSLFRHRSFVVGLGVGLSFFSVLAPFLVLLAEVPPDEAGSASGVVTMLQQLSFALGVAVIGSVFLVALGPNPGSTAYGRALDHALAWNIGLLTVTFVAAFALPARLRVRVKESGASA